MELLVSYRSLSPSKLVVLNCILKEVAKEIASALLLLYWSSFRQSKLPNEWKHAYVTPIFKEGDHSVGYRTIDWSH